MGKKWTVHEINNRFLRGAVAWLMLAPVLVVLLVIGIFEALHDAFSAFGERIADRFDEFYREIIKPYGWILAFRKEA